MSESAMPQRHHPVVDLALRLHRSRRYKSFKEHMRDLMLNAENPHKKYLDMTIIFLIVSSVFILIYEVKHPVPHWLDTYDIYVVSLVFLVEYLLRLWVSSDLSSELAAEYEEATFVGREFRLGPALGRGIVKKLTYMVTPSAIIDLLAIFPAYRPLRVLRIFVLFRFLKLLRYARSINQFVEVLATKRFELLTLLLLLAFVVTTGAIAIYVLEETHNSHINSIFDALYWSLVTISTVGYGDIAPVSPAGRVIAMMIILSGIAMISFATSVIVSAFSEKLTTLKEERVVDEINKNREFLIVCGYGQMAKTFLRQKEAHRYNYIILDTDPERVEEAIHDGFDAIHDDASRHETLARFRIEGSNVTVLALTNNDVENIYITLNAKSISSKIRVIARASGSDLLSKYRRAGADHVLLPNESASTMMVTAVTRPTMYKAIHAIFTGQHAARLDEVPIYSGMAVEGKQIRQIDFRRHKLALIGLHKGIAGTFIFNPDEATTLEVGDTLLVMGHRMSTNYFKEVMQNGVDV
jgi:voltage-gated potassium channel